MAPPLAMEVFGLLLVAALARTAPVQAQQEDSGIDGQSSCTERRVQYWAERSRDAVQRIKDTRFDLDTKIEVLGDLASTKDLDDYAEKLVESSLDSLNEIFQYGAMIFECPPEGADTVPKKGVIVDRIRQEMLIIMEHLRDILREGIPKQQPDQPQPDQPQPDQPQPDQPQPDQPQPDQPQPDQPQPDQPQPDQPQPDQPQAGQPQPDQAPQAQTQADSPQAEKTETGNQKDDETKRGSTELGLCIARVRQQNQGQDEVSIYQAITSQCQSKREVAKDPPSEDDETKRGATEFGLCIARVRQQNQGQDEVSIYQAIMSQCQTKRDLSLPLSGTQQNQEEEENKRGATELGLCIARVRQQNHGQDEASILQTVLSQCQGKREFSLPLSDTQQNQEDDETKRGATELGLCIARVRQQNQGQDEVSVFQAIMSQCQSKREVAKDLPSEDDETKRGATEFGLCIARVRQQNQGQDEVSVYQAIMSQCQSKRQVAKDPPSEDDETKRGATELGLCIARVRQQNQGQDEVSVFQAIMSQCQSKREIAKDPPSENDETKRGSTEFGLCIARVRQQHQGQDEVSIYQTITSQCQSKRVIPFEPFM